MRILNKKERGHWSLATNVPI